MTTSTQPIPQGMPRVVPYLTIKDTPAAIEFYERAFGAREMTRIPGPDGRLLHASITIGDAVIMMAEEFPEFGAHSPLTLGGSPVSVHLYCEDVDRAWAQAVAAGCTITMPLEDAFWGDRFGCLRDPFGHGWSMASHIKDMTTDEIIEAAAKIDFTAGCGKE